MEEYKIRKATLDDVSFIADVIITAEKGVSNKLSFSTLFNLTEPKVKELIISMLEEEIDGCEFSLSSYLITEFEGEPIAACCGWIEGFHEDESSKIIKSNLVSFTFPKESLKELISKADLISGILIDRKNKTLQFEYAYVMPGHRGKNIIGPMQEKMEEDAMRAYPELKKVQIQCFENSVYAIKMISRIGYRKVKQVTVENDEILNYLPDKTKYLMEKEFK